MNYTIIRDILLFVSVGAAFVGVVVYIRASQTHKTYILTIGIINFLISLAMLLIVVLAAVSLVTDRSADLFQGSLVQGSLLSTVAFVVGQTIYLFVPSSPFRQQIRQIFQRQVRLSAIQAPKAVVGGNHNAVVGQNAVVGKTHNAVMAQGLDKNSEIERKYLSCVCNDRQLTALQIIDMSAPLSLLDVYVDIKFYEGWDAQVAEQRKASERTQLGRYEQAEDAKNSGRPAYAPDDLIAKDGYKHCVILGDLGIGKTTALRHLTLQRAQKRASALEKKAAGTSEEISIPPIPIYIELNAFASHGNADLSAFIAATVSGKYFLDKATVKVWLNERLERGDVLLLLDALDETLIGKDYDTARKVYDKVRRSILTFANTYDRVHIFVTSRKASYDAYPPTLRSSNPPFSEFEISGFGRQQDRDTFVNHWFKKRLNKSENVLADNLIALLKYDERLQSLTKNPLLLSLVAMVYERGLSLPYHRAILYESCVDILLGRGAGASEWDSSKGVERQLDFPAEMKQSLLEGMAWWYFQKEGKPEAFEEEVLAHIKTFLRKNNENPEKALHILDEITMAHGLLKVEKTKLEEPGATPTEEKEVKIYRFLHPSFHAYFAAYNVIHEKQLDQLLRHRWEERWEEVILLYSVYIEKDVQPLWKGLAENENDDDIFLTNLILTGRCIASASSPGYWMDFSEKVKERLFLVLEDPTSHHPTTDHVVIYRLTRDRVAMTLVEIGSEHINIQLLEILEKNSSWQIPQMSIIKALSYYGQPSLMKRLMRLLSNTNTEEENSAVRERIVDILGRLRDPSIAQDFVRLLFNRNTKVQLQRRIIKNLSYLEEPSLLPELKTRWYDSKMKMDEEVEKRIVEILGQQADLTLLKELFPLLGDESIRLSTRCAFVLALAKRNKDDKDKDDKPDIANALRPLSIASQPEVSLRANCLLALYALGEGDSLVENLLAIIENKENNVKIGSGIRRDLVSALGDLRAVTLAPRLVTLLTNEKVNGEVRQKIAEVLGKLGNQEIVQDLITYLKYLDAQTDKATLPIYVEIIHSLGVLRDHTVVDTLLDLIADRKLAGHDIVLNAAAKELAKCSADLEIADKIKTHLQQIRHLNNSYFKSFRKGDPRRSIVITLGMLGDISVLDELLLFLLEPGVVDDERERVEKAIESLSEKAVEDLTGNYSEKVIETQAKLRQELFKEQNKSHVHISKSILRLLKALAEDEETCQLLANRLDTSESELSEDIYDALWTISRRGGFKVIRDRNGLTVSYRIEKYEMVLS